MPRSFLYTFSALVIAFLLFQVLENRIPSQSTSVSQPFKVLFIGNSYTFSNSMPTMLTALSKNSESQREIQSKSVTIPGATLQVLWEKGLAKQAIQERNWDFVVLQEHSMLPTREPERMYHYARQFNAEIRKNGSKTILFLTWARRGKPEMQLSLNHAYFSLAKELDIQVAPIGPAWQKALEFAPTIALHREDGSHPTPAGSYLTACVFYLVMVENQEGCPVIQHVDISQDAVAVANRAAVRSLLMVQ